MDGQSFNIPLNSAITIRSERMFESVQAPKMLYNPQLYQNGVLQNSFRFEHDGFASGDNVYEFVGLSGFISTVPEGYLVTKSRYTENTYSIEFAGTSYSLKYNAIVASHILIDTEPNSLHVETANGATTLTGKFNNTAFTVSYDHLTKEVLDDQENFIASARTDNNYVTTFTIKDVVNSQQFNISKLNAGSALKSVYGYTSDEIVTANTTFAEFKTMIDDVYTWQLQNATITYSPTPDNIYFIDERLAIDKQFFTSATSSYKVRAQVNRVVFNGSCSRNDYDIDFDFTKTYSIPMTLPLSTTDYSVQVAFTKNAQQALCKPFSNCLNTNVTMSRPDFKFQDEPFNLKSGISGYVSLPYWDVVALPTASIRSDTPRVMPLNYIGCEYLPPENDLSGTINTAYKLIAPSSILCGDKYAYTDNLFSSVDFADASGYTSSTGAYAVKSGRRGRVYYYPSYFLANYSRSGRYADLFQAYTVADDVLPFIANVTLFSTAYTSKIKLSFLINAVPKTLDHIATALLVLSGHLDILNVDIIDILTNIITSELNTATNWQLPVSSIDSFEVLTGTLSELQWTIETVEVIRCFDTQIEYFPFTETETMSGQSLNIYRLNMLPMFFTFYAGSHFYTRNLGKNPLLPKNDWAGIDLERITFNTSLALEDVDTYDLIYNDKFSKFYSCAALNYTPLEELLNFPPVEMLISLSVSPDTVGLFTDLPQNVKTYYNQYIKSLSPDAYAQFVQQFNHFIAQASTNATHRVYSSIQYSLDAMRITRKTDVTYFTADLQLTDFDVTSPDWFTPTGKVDYFNGVLVFVFTFTKPESSNYRVHSLSKSTITELTIDAARNIVPDYAFMLKEHLYRMNYLSTKYFESGPSVECNVLPFTDYNSDTGEIVPLSLEQNLIFEGPVFKRLNTFVDNELYAERQTDFYKHKDLERLRRFLYRYTVDDPIQHSVLVEFTDNIASLRNFDDYASVQQVSIFFRNSSGNIVSTIKLAVTTAYVDGQAKSNVQWTSGSMLKTFSLKDIDCSVGFITPNNRSYTTDLTVCNVLDGIDCVFNYDYVITSTDGIDTILFYDWLVSLKISLLVTIPYNMQATLCHSTDPVYTLTRVDNNNYYLQHLTTQRNNFVFNRNTFKCSGTTSGGLSFEERYPFVVCPNANEYEISFERSYDLEIPCLLKGLIDCTGFTVVDYTDTEITVQVPEQSVPYHIDLHKLFDTANTSRLKVISTDIHTNETREIKELNCEAELQVLTQQWDTSSETEAFWWIDKTHILRETDTSFILAEKTGNIDNWRADNWQDITCKTKEHIITDRVLDYDVTSAQNNAAVLFTVSDYNALGTQANSIYITVYDVLNDFNCTAVEVPVCVKQLGYKLNDDSIRTCINTYSNITSTYILNTSKISSTRIANFVLIGIHCDNNFNQWTVIINIQSGEHFVFQGYGFVGINGALTGGEIPSAWLNSLTGFSGIVQPLSYLNIFSATADAEQYDIQELGDLQYLSDPDSHFVVGTDKQQWYIADKLSSIVSHCLFEVSDAMSGVFTIKPEYLALNNNYSVLYKSNSFRRSLLGDLNVSFKAVGNLLEDSGVSSEVINFWQGIWSHALNPHVLVLQPRLSNINYLQQSLGQYAYVHYNSTKQTPENTYKSTDQKQLSDVVKRSEWEPERKLIHALSEDDLVFDTQSIRQESSYKKISEFTSLFVFAIVQTGIDIIKQTPTAINNLINQTTTSSFGKQFGQAFAQNLTNMTNTQLSLNTLFASITSEVTAVKSLDMFYSTSSLQKVCAGRGYVNHNFVAQCVAQSVTSTQLEISQMQMYYLMKELTLWQLDVEYYTFDILADGLLAVVNGIPTGGDISYAVSIIAAAVGIAAYTAVSIGKAYIKALRDISAPLLAGFGGDRLRSMLTAGKSHHEYSIEGKHKYGSKTEHFMWPCFMLQSAVTILDEQVQATVLQKDWLLNAPTKRLESTAIRILDDGNTTGQGTIIKFVTDSIDNTAAIEWDQTKVPAFYIGCKGVTTPVMLPGSMSCVQGVESFLSPQWFKNENINESEPVFPVPIIHDYCLNNDWKLGITASAGETIWVSVGDTKIIDGDYTNIVIYDDEFCGIASTYTAVELKHGIFEQYVRPFNLTPKVLGLNNTGYNVLYDDTLYHGFDGFGYRIESWIGSSGMNKDFQTLQYNFIANDRFKRSNKLPPNQFLGNFKTDPICNLTCNMDDKIVTIITQPSNNTGITVGVPGEDKDVLRYAIPVCAEPITLAPATIKTLSSYELSVVDGVTSICTDIRNTQSEYKANTSVDFNLQGKLYRYCDEYISELTNESGVVVANKLVLCIGLEFLGASPYEAYFYNYDTKLVYIYTGGTSISIFGRAERFDRIKSSNYDFINQCIVLTYTGNESLVLNNRVFDRNIMPPTKLIYNEESGYKVNSLAGGYVFQGPNRCSITRAVYSPYMLKDILKNRGNWKKMNKYDYIPRDYQATFEHVTKSVNTALDGWTHNPFVFQTAPLGLSEDIDALFEWTITFAWNDVMDQIYTNDMYAVVNIDALSYAPGGTIESNVAHVYLTKRLFGKDTSGYYSYKFISNSGACNRESLRIWSDAVIAVSNLTVTVKPVTQNRASVLTQHVDVQNMQEL